MDVFRCDTSRIFSDQGFFYAWKEGTKQRWFLLTLVLSSIGSILLVWLLGWLFQTNTWAYKSFLGVVLLFYMLTGMSFSTIKQNWIRGMLVLLTFGIAIISLIPYYTVPKKDFSRDAFLSLPKMEDSDIVLLERAYASPLAYYYLGIDQQVLALNYQNDLMYPLLDAEFGSKFIYGYDNLSCSDLDLHEIGNVWIYGSEQVVRERLMVIPNCFGNAQLWIWENGGVDTI